jgi:Putative MetA-pathway of phenol degradation
MIRVSVAVWVTILLTSTAGTQELEPRAYSASPVGINFFVVGVARSHGDVLTDPSIALKDVSATIDTLLFGYGHTFALAGRQALVVGLLPIASAEASGRIGEETGNVTRSGLADARFKLSVGLAGAPALTPAAFAQSARRTAIGASVSVVVPVGQYDRRRLINLGTNRWSFKPEVGISFPFRRWTFESYAGLWLFMPNDSYYPGSARRTQDTLLAIQAHVSYEVGRHGWIAFDGTWYAGGESSLNGVRNGDRENNTRIGATLSIPVTRGNSLKFSYSTGATTRVGSDFNTLAITWQVTVF